MGGLNLDLQKGKKRQTKRNNDLNRIQRRDSKSIVVYFLYTLGLDEASRDRPEMLLTHFEREVYIETTKVRSQARRSRGENRIYNSFN